MMWHWIKFSSNISVSHVSTIPSEIRTRLLLHVVLTKMKRSSTKWSQLMAKDGLQRGLRGLHCLSIMSSHVI